MKKKTRYVRKGGLHFGARRRFVVDEDGGGVKCVPIDKRRHRDSSGTFFDENPSVDHLYFLH